MAITSAEVDSLVLNRQIRHKPQQRAQAFGYVTELCLERARESPLESLNRITTTPTFYYPPHQHHQLLHLTAFLPTSLNSKSKSPTFVPTTKPTMPGLTSASGVLGFLFDEEPELKIFALQTLNEDIDTVWTEVAGAVGQM